MSYDQDEARLVIVEVHADVAVAAALDCCDHLPQMRTCWLGPDLRRFEVSKHSRT